MKRFVLSILFVILITGFAFAELQIDNSVGYFFNTDTYDSVKRSFNGLNLNITPRYFFNKNIGIFIGGDFKAWFSANNSEYVDLFETAGMTAKIDDSIGFKLDFDFGLALAYPVSDKFGLQMDLGLSTTVLALDSISGTLEWEDYYYYYKANTDISIDKISSMGIYVNIFGRYLLLDEGKAKSYFTFGFKIDYKFTRDESGKIIIAGISQKYSGSESNFSGLSIAPFIGYMGSF
jgi:hypothetical protein